MSSRADLYGCGVFTYSINIYRGALACQVLFQYRMMFCDKTHLYDRILRGIKLASLRIFVSLQNIFCL